MVLVELSASGEPLPAKTCLPCPARTRVFPSSDRYTCLSCPDPRMTMSSGGSCVCDSGYTATGRPTLGTTACVPTSVVCARCIACGVPGVRAHVTVAS